MFPNLQGRLLNIDSKRPIWNTKVLDDREISSSSKAGQILEVAASGLIPNYGLLNAHKEGLVLSLNTGSPATRIDISAGATVTNITEDFPVVLPAMTKAINQNWSYGGIGGRLPDELYNDTYHVFVLYNPVTRQSDIAFDNDVTATHRPVGYHARRIGSFNVFDAAIQGFTQFGSYFELKNVEPELTYFPIPSIPYPLYVGSVPDNISTRMQFTLTSGLAAANTNLAMEVSGVGESPVTPRTSSLNSNFRGRTSSYYFLNGSDVIFFCGVASSSVVCNLIGGQITLQATGSYNSSSNYSTLSVWGWQDFNLIEL